MKINQSFRHLASITASTVFLFASGKSSASDDFSNGDLAIGFYQIVGGVVQSNTYVFNLGPAYLYRENTVNNVSVSAINTSIASSNISADLVSAFGSTWADSGTVFWCVAGLNENFAATVQGDPGTTNYLSAARSNLAPGATGKNTSFTNISQTNRGILANNLSAFLLTGTNAGINQSNNSVSTPGANLQGAILPISNTNSLEDFLPPATLTYFGIGNVPRQQLSITTLGGGAGVKGALDMYRVLQTTVDADLTAGASTGNATVGIGQFIGTLTIDAAGDLKIQSVGAPVAGYTSWATTNGATGQAADLDHDNDGVSNGVEYFIGGPTGNTTGFTPLPGVTTVGNVSSITWSKSANYTGTYNTGFFVETSTTLASGSWTTETLGSSVIISGNNVTFSFPAGPLKKFARLKVKP